MHWFSIGVALLAAVAIIGVGVMYLAAPTSMMKSFGLPLPAPDAAMPWWLRLKGSRDIVSGLVVFAVMAWGGPRLLGAILLVLSLIPLSDMSTVLAARGSAKTALSVHGLTAAVMIAAAVPLVLGIA